MRNWLPLLMIFAGGLSGCGDTPSDTAASGDSEPSEQSSAGSQSSNTTDATPEAVVQSYLDAMKEGTAPGDLTVLSKESSAMLRQWRVTPGQMATLAGTYRSCTPEAARTSADDTLAVVRYPKEERKCSPWFLIREDENWRLDLVTPQALLRFGQGNAWRFDPSKTGDNPYAFAFDDWHLDTNGYPQ